jgi:hypothetical protein
MYDCRNILNIKERYCILEENILQEDLLCLSGIKLYQLLGKNIIRYDIKNITN